MQFVQGLPSGVYVGQTRVHHAKAQASVQPELVGFNLALHVGDDAKRVQQHRMALLQEFADFGVDKMTWMTQTHSTICHTINEKIPFTALEGDGLVTQRKAHALMMMTADCLPVVLGNADGTEIANLHAGWRGLANGIVENTIATMQSQPTWAWLGAAISQPCFEIGEEVKFAFCSKYPELERAFKCSEKPAKFYADLYAIARFILQQHGVDVVLGGDQCSYQQAEEY
ncbi:MAG: polyphenol oxidase family protein, partial [Acinetobacter bohemicus]